MWAVSLHASFCFFFSSFSCSAFVTFRFCWSVVRGLRSSEQVIVCLSNLMQSLGLLATFLHVFLTRLSA